MGLRYEYSSVPEERNGATSHVTDLTLETPLAQLNEPGALYKNPMGKAFSPRVGFAWAPGDAKTSHSGRLRHVLRAPRVLPHPYRAAGTTAVQSVGTHRRRRREPARASAPLPGCVHHAGRHARRPCEHARVPVRPRHLVRLSLESDRSAPVRSELGRDRGLHRDRSS